MRRFSFGLLFYILAACSTPPDLAVQPTQQIIRVAFPPSLRPVTERLRDCSKNFSAIALFLEEWPASHLDSLDHDIILWAGEPPDTAPFAFLIEQAEILVVIHPDNPESDLTDSEIRNLFSGQIQTWDEAEGNDEQVAVWIYPPENDIQRLFSEAFMGGDEYSPFALIAPDSEAMMEAISADPGAIGLLPGKWDSGSLKTVDLKSPIRLPILALTAGEPGGETRELLACLQDPAELRNAP